jgi:hypothetical protein
MVVHEWVPHLNIHIGNWNFYIVIQHFHYDALTLFSNPALCAYDLGFIPKKHP